MSKSHTKTPFKELEYRFWLTYQKRFHRIFPPDDELIKASWKSIEMFLTRVCYLRILF